MMLDATKGDVQKSLLQKELESVGIRLNTKKPNIYFKVYFKQNIEQKIF
jgi:ribosome-interacting GTPase 1